MKKFRVVVTETISYEVYVKAKNREDAEEFALDKYGYDGNVFHTDANAVLIEEEE